MNHQFDFIVNQQNCTQKVHSQELQLPFKLRNRIHKIPFALHLFNSAFQTKFLELHQKDNNNNSRSGYSLNTLHQYFLITRFFVLHTFQKFKAFLKLKGIKPIVLSIFTILKLRVREILSAFISAVQNMSDLCPFNQPFFIARALKRPQIKSR